MLFCKSHACLNAKHSFHGTPAPCWIPDIYAGQLSHLVFPFDCITKAMDTLRLLYFCQIFLFFSGFVVECGWTSKGRCPFIAVIFMMASISSQSLLSSLFTWAASPTPSPLEDCWATLLTITRSSEDICIIEINPETANQPYILRNELFTHRPVGLVFVF